MPKHRDLPQYLTGHKGLKTLVEIYTHIQRDDVGQCRAAMDPLAGSRLAQKVLGSRDPSA